MEDTTSTQSSAMYKPDREHKDKQYHGVLFFVGFFSSTRVLHKIKCPKKVTSFVYIMYRSKMSYNNYSTIVLVYCE